MATTPLLADFVARYTEFADIPAQYTGLVQLTLEEAARATNADMYPTAQSCQDAVFLKTAVLLSTSPHARAMRLTGGEQAARYEYELKKRQRSATMGRRVF